jgi:hypothetical protein
LILNQCSFQVTLHNLRQVVILNEYINVNVNEFNV